MVVEIVVAVVVDLAVVVAVVVLVLAFAVFSSWSCCRGRRGRLRRPNRGFRCLPSYQQNVLLTCHCPYLVHYCWVSNFDVFLESSMADYNIRSLFSHHHMLLHYFVDASCTLICKVIIHENFGLCFVVSNSCNHMVFELSACKAFSEDRSVFQCSCSLVAVTRLFVHWPKLADARGAECLALARGRRMIQACICDVATR